MLAKVILCRCDQKHTFGIRIEKRGDDWVRTWAFKIDETSAKHEGFEKTHVTGSFEVVDRYPGCPYCSSKKLDFCTCGGINCASGESEPDADDRVKLTCNWCGETDYYTVADDLLDANAGGM